MSVIQANSVLDFFLQEMGGTVAEGLYSVLALVTVLITLFYIIAELKLFIGKGK